MLRAVTALDHFDASKHSVVIAYVNRIYVKEGIFDKALSKMLDKAYRLRENADYKDFEIISRDMAKADREGRKDYGYDKTISGREVEIVISNF